MGREDEQSFAFPKKKASGEPLSWIAKKLPWRADRFPKAFEGDTYVSDLHKAAKAKKPWVGLLVVGVLFSAIADWWLLTDTFNIALEDEAKLLTIPIFSGLIAFALLAAYLMLGYLAGKNWREYRAFDQGSSLIAFSLFVVADFAVLLFLFLFRLYGEIEKNGGFGGNSLGLGFGGGAQGGTLQLGSGSSSANLFAEFMEKTLELGFDVIFPALALSLIMIIGAILGASYAYLSYDPYSGEKKKLAEAYVAEDKQLYEKVFFEHAFSPKKNLEYEHKERDLDKRAVSSAFKIDKLVAQLNGIVDPADAYDFCAIGRLLDNELIG